MTSLRLLNRGFGVGVVLTGLTLFVGWGQSTGPYDLEWSSVDSGSGRAQGGNYLMNHTAGQPDVLLLQKAQYQLFSGFWGMVAQGPTETPTPVPTASPTQTVTPTPTPSVTATPTCSVSYDLTGDGSIDAGDLLLLLDYIRNNDLRGDFNCDGKADCQDLLLFSKEWYN